MIEVELPDGTIAEFPDEMQPAQIEAVLAAQFGAPAQPAAPQQPPGIADRIMSIPGMRPLAEFSSAANRQVLGALDIVPGAINDVLAMTGTDYRMPGFEQNLGSQGGYMDEGLGRDVVQSAGSVLPAALGGGALIRGAAQGLPAMASGAESIGAGLLRQMGTTTAKGDAALGALSGAGSAVGGAAGEAIGGEDGRQIGQAAGGFAAPLAPATLSAAAGQTVRRAFRGGEQGRQILSRAVDDFAEFGAAPTVGTGTDDNLRQGLENLSSRFIGGGALRKASEKAAEKMQARLAAIADDVSIVKGSDEAGRAIEQGIRGEGGFIDRFKATSNKLWGALDSKIPAASQVKPEKTVDALNAMVRDDSVGKVLNNSKIEGVSKALRDALGPVMTNNSTLNRVVRDSGQAAAAPSKFTGAQRAEPDFSRTLGTRPAEFEGGTAQQVPIRNLATGAPVVRDTIAYGDLKALRSQIGEMIGSKDLVSDIPRAQLKRLYSALSEDVKTAAANAGAAKEFARANSYTRAGHGRIEGFVEKIVNKGELDKIFEAAAKGGDGLQRINAIKRSLKPEEWEVVSSNVIRRLGQATKGQQDAAGESFSVAKFLTDWNGLGRAKNVIFSGSDKLKNYRDNLDKIARASERMKFAAREMQNPSGTAQAIANYGTISAGGASLATGNLGTFGMILMTVAANKGASTLMANPTFVRWLARSTTVKDMPAHIAALGALNAGDDEDLAAFASDLSAVIAGQDQPKAQKAEAQRTSR